MSVAVAHVHKMTRLDVGPPKRYVCEVESCAHAEEVPHNPAWDLPPPPPPKVFVPMSPQTVAVEPAGPHAHRLNRLDVGPPKRFVCDVPGCGHSELVHPPPTGDVTQTVAAAAGEILPPRSPQPAPSVIREGKVRAPLARTNPEPTAPTPKDEDDDDEGGL